MLRSTATSQLQARGEIRRRAGRYHLELEVITAGGRAERVLEATDCRSLAKTAAWLMALAVDPAASPPASEADGDAAAQSHSAPPKPSVGSNASAPEQPAAARPEALEPAPAAEAQATSAPDAAPQAEPAAPARVRFLRIGPGLKRPPARWFRANLAVGIWGAKLVAPQPSLRARFGWGTGVLYLEAIGGVMLPSTRSVPLMAPAEVRFSSAEVGAAACALWGERLRAGPCLGLSALHTRGRVEGISQPERASAWWGDASLSLAAGFVVLRAIELFAEAGAGLPLTARPAFAVDGVGKLAEAAYVSGFARLGLGVRTR
jgi:hypothetical protein